MQAFAMRYYCRLFEHFVQGSCFQQEVRKKIQTAFGECDGPVSLGPRFEPTNT